MPWWVWLLLVLFMIAMLAAGVVYAGLHGLRGIKTVGAVGSQLGERVAAMGKTEDETEPPQVPVFTEPLRSAADRYTAAQTRIAERRQAKRERHARQWGEWNRR